MIYKDLQKEKDAGDEGIIYANRALNKKAFKIIILSYTTFLVFAFLNFSVSILFVSKNLVPVAISNVLLNLIPIYFISKYLIKRINSRKIVILFWASTIILSILLVIPFGEFLLDYALSLF